MESHIISDVIPIISSIPLNETIPKQEWLDEWSKQLFVKICSNHTCGWGEILSAAFNSPNLYADIVRRFEPFLKNIEFTEPNIIWEKLRKLTFSGGYGPIIGAISGIDIALWDLKARISNVYLGDILGKNENSVIRYASLSRYANPDKVSKASINISKMGFEMIKLHQTKDDTLESVKKIREKLGYSIDLMVDMNCSMKLEEAIQFANSVQKYELKWLEEPIWPPDDHASLKKVNDIIPVAAGENFFSYYTFEKAVQMDALTYFQPDVTKIGGLTPTLKIIDLLKKNNKKLAFHNRPHNGWVGIFASIAASKMSGINAIIETPPNNIPDQYFKYSAEVENKYITVKGIGLGIDPIEPLPSLKNEKVLIFHH
ncbi:MAG: mandelate racemase/muconate lactonizing enzyme family protein [Thermoplasmata archaeon]